MIGTSKSCAAEATHILIPAAARSNPESPFSAPGPWNCIAPEADYEAKRTFVPKEPAFAEEKPGDSLPSLPLPPHREPSKGIVPTPIHPPLAFVVRIRCAAVGRLGL